MPTRQSTLARSANTYKRQRTAAKKKQYTRIPTQIKVGKQTFPKQLFNTLRYTEEITANFSGGLWKYLWVANGMYDPNSTGTGHQPLYFDQLTAIYDHYTVLRSRIKAYFLCPSTISTGIVVSIYVDDDASVKGDALTAAEMPGAKSYGYVPAAGPCPLLTHSWDAKKTFGGNPQSQAELQGTASANPTEISIYSIQAYDYSAAISGAVYCYVDIEYDVVWDEHVTIGSS